MAYDELLADRIRLVLKEKQVKYKEMKMMGGLTILVDGKMCVGIIKNNLMARVGPEYYEEALRQEGCKLMDFTKKPLKGYVYVEPHAIDMDDDLSKWIQLCLDYNPLAKASKKKK
ncbi:TfoX/Sxy family protein [Carboxylicivirga sp. N1Y90]|uniref:TfoX/Sxy family protein n=1 Tax=Carboxylicivirga fragile TaxID=3417571 RepID=UPI003D331902|nr:TfoX/Sxy family protein [Marinilabiliaceae bacterium N1Y90]